LAADIATYPIVDWKNARRSTEPQRWMVGLR
jgi:hypothetical protein